MVGEHISVDNIYFYRTSALVDDEAPANVSAEVASASYFGGVLNVSATDNSGAIQVSVKDGNREVGVGGGASGASLNVTVAGLLPNTAYTLSVIVSDEAGNEAAPVEVQLITAVAPAPAPTPDFSNMDAVVPVFTDAQAGGPVINIGGWGQATAVAFGELAAGDHVQYFSNMNYLGWELASSVNATDMEYLHVDFYTQSLTNLSVTPISPGHEGAYVVNLTQNEWNSVDIPLSVYEANTIDWSNIFQMKFFLAAPEGGDLFVDNVYFYKPKSGTGVENVNIENKAQKVLINGVVYIIRDGARYTVFGQKIQ